ncbi:hypothetical protein [Clostridium sp. AWRP]|uniref:hypothetical protein n=1 Tax=Clostridium sp. AWRP TaxID=2212991 RepID=UPI000FD87486|nr:hypothetical protein [Clostridium sp. AWRP]
MNRLKLYVSVGTVEETYLFGVGIMELKQAVIISCKSSKYILFILKIFSISYWKENRVSRSFQHIYSN